MNAWKCHILSYLTNVIFVCLFVFWTTLKIKRYIKHKAAQQSILCKSAVAEQSQVTSSRYFYLYEFTYYCTYLFIQSFIIWIQGKICISTDCQQLWQWLSILHIWEPPTAQCNTLSYAWHLLPPKLTALTFSWNMSCVFMVFFVVVVFFNQEAVAPAPDVSQAQPRLFSSRSYTTTTCHCVLLCFLTDKHK